MNNYKNINNDHSISIHKATMNVNNEEMAACKPRPARINFEGDSRDLELPSAATLSSLQASVASAFSTDLPADAGVLSFTYKDGDGDYIVLDKDSELQLALRLGPGSLEISAARKDNEVDKGKVPARKGDPKGRLLKIAARNLREYNGVPSMTPAKLTTTLALLKLGPRRLVEQGLAPRVLLARMRAIDKGGGKQQPRSGGDDEHLAASVASGMEVMSLENEEGRDDGRAAADQPAAADNGDVSFESSASDDEDDENAPVDDSSTDDDEHDDVAAAPDDAPGVVKKNLLHRALVDGGVQLRPREVRPLLLALAVKPCRLARLGLVDAKDLRAMLHAERKKANTRNGGRGRGGGHGMGEHGPFHPYDPLHHHPHHPRHRDMARGGLGAPPRGPFSGFPKGPPGLKMRRYGGVGGRGGGGGGGGCGRRGPGGPGAGGKMMRRHHHAHPPPPPPPHADEEDDEGMFDAPAESGLPNAGVHGPPHPHPHPHPHHSPHIHLMEDGGDGFHHSAPPGMRMRNKMRRARNGGGGGAGGSQHVQQGRQHWG